MSKFHHATQNSVQFKAYELFISGIFQLIFLDHDWPQITETMESKTANKVCGGLAVYFKSPNLKKNNMDFKNIYPDKDNWND